MRRHLGKGKQLKLGEDIFDIPPLTIEHLPEFFAVAAKLQDGDMSKLNTETMSQLINLLRVTCERSKDIDTTDESLLQDFIVANFIELLITMIEVNTASISDSNVDKIKKMGQHGPIITDNKTP